MGFRGALGAVVVVLGSAAVVAAQSTAVAQVSGVVRDGSGGVLPGADVAATQTDTGLVRTTVSGAQGDYILTNLPVGPYKLDVSLQGFRSYSRTGLVLQVNANAVIDATLELGDLAETVTVVADVPLLETRSTAVGQVIDNQRILEMPLNGRRATELILLSGAAVPVAVGGFQSSRNFPTVQISVAGGSVGGLTYVMDGGTHNDPQSALNMPIPFPDALQEFKVETSAVPARYGHHATAAVNIVTKSGANTLHGSAFEFFRNGSLNAKNAFALRKDSLRRNQFGATLGGALVQDRLFYFGGYQGTEVRTDPSTTIGFVPTPAMIAGDFTAAASPQCNSGRQVALRAPFADNRIDPSQFDAVALGYLRYLPTPTDPCGRYQYGAPSPSSEYQILGRIDYQVSQKQSAFVRYFIGNYDLPYFKDEGNALTTAVPGQLNRGQSTVFGHTYVFSGSLINSFRGTVNAARNIRQAVPFVTPADLGARITAMTPDYTPLAVTNGPTFGGGAANSGHWNSLVLQAANDLDYIKGNHQISTGVNYIHASLRALNTQFTNEQMTINGTRTGMGLADFLLGTVSTFQQSNAQIDYQRQHYLALYLQDTWKVSSRMTVNAGLRWEPYFPMTHPDGRVMHFSAEDFQAGRRSRVYVNAPVGLTFPGDDGYPGNAMNFGDKNRWAPRVGLVFDPRGKGQEVIRAGYGIFYDLPTMFYNIRAAIAPPWGGSTTLNNVQMSNPYANAPGGNPFPTTLSPTMTFPLAGTYVSQPLDLDMPTIQQWNVTTQKQFFTNWSASVGYIGNHTDHVLLGQELNPAVYIPGASTAANTNARRRLTRLNQAEGQYYGSITQANDSGTGSYHGLLLSVQKRFSDHFSLLSNYTLSRCVNDGDIQQNMAAQAVQNPDDIKENRGPCVSDRKHVYIASAVVGTPSLGSSFLGRLGSDWQFSAIFRALSGTPLTITDTRDNALNGVTTQRPNLVGDPEIDDPSAARWFNTAAYSANVAGQLGNSRRGGIRGPGAWSVDAGITRSFTLFGNRAEFRAEAFNLFNTVRLNNPVTNIASPDFGRVTGADDPRIMQLAVKYVF